VLRHARDADKIGIDCPLGWPDLFVEFLCTHRTSGNTPSSSRRAKWRRSLSHRRTDEHVRTPWG